MKPRLHILFALSVVLAFGCTAPDSDKVIVHGNVENLGKSPLCISYYIGDQIIAYDTVFSSRSGKFDFKISGYDEISPVTIYFSEKKCWTTLFAQSGDRINIKGNIHLVDLLSVSGGVVNDDLSRFKNKIRKLYVDRLSILNGQYASAEESEEHLAEINLSLKRLAKEYIKENPSSIASVVLIQDFFYQDYDPSTKELLNLLVGDARDFHLTTRILEGIQSW